MNNTNYTEQQLREAYEKSPDSVKRLIVDENLGYLVQAIGRENGVTPEQALDIEYEVVRTLLGLHNLEELSKNIKDVVGESVSGEIVWKIARDIRNDIFTDIKPLAPTLESGEELEIAKSEKTETKELPKVPVPSPKDANPRTIYQGESSSITNIPTPEKVWSPFEEKLKAIHAVSEAKKDDAISVDMNRDTPKTDVKNELDPYRETIE